MRKEKTIEINCATCGKIFTKNAREHKRRIKMVKLDFSVDYRALA
jgi:DNA-directed RNA polymerase subunit N (RpoN/RPB10)